MNVLKKLLPLAVVSVLAAVLSTGCKPKVEPENPATRTTVSLNKSAVDLTVGQSITLTATLKLADAKEAVTSKFTGDDILGSDFTNANRITTNDEGKARVIYSVAGTDVKAEIEVDSSFNCKDVTYIYKKK